MTPSLLILTGSGVSAESGLGTFRDTDGIWAKFDWQRLATPEGFRDDPSEVHAFYNARRQGLRGAAPNAAHAALATLEAAWVRSGGEFTLVTQNIDDLHERAGSERLIHMHGELLRSRCAACGDLRDCDGDLSITMSCGACGREGQLRPHVVWFGEIPIGMDEIYALLPQATHFAAIGTSGAVWPAAGFAEEAGRAGAKTWELSLDAGESGHAFTHAIYGNATETVPAWCERLLSETFS
ncbi:Sir2 family NAD-dependent protein deacetylase [Hyphobacterium sp.]|uniref:Sir2 family NAD-dependent protein deacetylase n=1 Tax=Hyphobacterium sp. TaxID=2004662 RepID=UPI003BAD8E49